MKPDCYKCKYRGDVPGSAHSCCNHPSVQQEKEDPLNKIMSIFASVGRTPPMKVETNKIHVTGNKHGISHGWFNWPWNFDTVWLESCDGFEPKENKEAKMEENDRT